MAELVLRTNDGQSERRELSRSQPISFGSQAVNDVVITEADVRPLHGRIGWNKSGYYEVTAATADGVDVNGQLVQHARLRSGDVVRVGSWDLIFRDTSMKHTDGDSDRDLKKGAGKAKSEKSPGSRKTPEKEPEALAEDNQELSLFEGSVLAESMAEMLEDPEILPESSAEVSAELLSRFVSEGEVLSRGGEEVKSKVEPTLGKELKRTVRAALSANRVRPGEQDIFKSPLVLSLGGGALVVLLVTGTLWFLMGRQVAMRLYDQGVAELGEGKYTPAIATFESFVERYPQHRHANDARLGIGRARIQKELAGATPNWKRAKEELDNFIKEYRETDDFPALKPGVCQFAEQIAIGSAKTAETVKDPELLVTSADAKLTLVNFSDPQQPPTVALEQIEDLTRKANAAIRKQQMFDSSFVIIDKALSEKHPIEALRERAHLVQNYRDFENHKRVRDALQQAIDQEKSVITIEDLNRDAETTDNNSSGRDCVIPIFHTRSRTEETASGRFAYAVAHDSCYAVEVVTGETAWRRVIGAHTPFFPTPTTGAHPGLLVGETQPHGLALFHAESGELIWRQSVDEPLSGSPLIHEGEIFAASEGGSLYRLDLDTGRLKAKMTFSQPVIGPPAVAPDGNHLLIAGESSLIYGLSIRPLEVSSVTFTSHPSHAVVVPLLTMGKLVLMCDNDQLQNCNLRSWNASEPESPLKQVDSKRVEGQVVDRPVLRGAQLVVASSGERLTAFTVSDNPEKPGLAFIGTYKIQEGYQGPMYLALGPDQQFWLESSEFRRFQVLNDNLRLDQNSTAPGIAAQPLQIVGDQFFVGRRPPYAEGVIFTQVDRERMAGSWRTVIGARTLAWTENRNGGLICASENGSLFSLSDSRLQQPGVELRSGIELEIPAGVTEPLGATRLHDGRLAVWCGGSQPRLWLINSSGQMESETKLTAGLLAAPVLLKGGLVLPQEGRLKWQSLSREVPRVQDFATPVVNGTGVRWAFLARLDDSEFVACDTEGRLSRMQIREDDVVHLAEAAKFTLPQPVDLPPALIDEELWLADSTGVVRCLDGRSFDVKAERTFPEPVLGLWSEGKDCFVQQHNGTLHCVTNAAELPDRWQVELPGVQLLGSPVRQGTSLIWASRDGTIVQLAADSGEELGRTRLPQSLTHGIISVGQNLYASANDGALYRVTPPQGDQP